MSVNCSISLKKKTIATTKHYAFKFFIILYLLYLLLFLLLVVVLEDDAVNLAIHVVGHLLKVN